MLGGGPVVVVEVESESLPHAARRHAAARSHVRTAMSAEYGPLPWSGWVGKDVVMAERPVVIVTGGSRGIGAATCVALAGRGYDLCINYASDSVAASGVAHDCEAAGARTVVVQADVSDDADVVRLFDTAVLDLGRLDGLVNNAAVVFPLGRVVDLELARIRRTFEVNVHGAMLCAREAVRRMSTERGGDGGVIVNLSSAAARLGSPNAYVEYAASKAAVDALTVGLAQEVIAEGIRVVGVRPGIVDTEIHVGTGGPERLDSLAATTPIGRAATAAEIANAVVWLLSDEASYVAGATIDVTGGR